MPIPKPKSNESQEEFISRCMSDEKMKSDYDNEQRYAICINTYTEMNEVVEELKDILLEETYNDYPQEATENAKTALRYAEENGWGDCLEATGKARANQLANKENISKDTISRMASFERHRQHSKKELGDGCGRLAWLAWGGDAGIEWAQRKLKQLEDGKA